MQKGKKVQFAVEEEQEEQPPLKSLREMDGTGSLIEPQLYFSEYNSEQLLQFKSPRPTQSLSDLQIRIEPKTQSLLDNDDEIELDDNGESIQTKRDMQERFYQFDCFLMKNRKKIEAISKNHHILEQPISSDRMPLQTNQIQPFSKDEQMMVQQQQEQRDNSIAAQLLGLGINSEAGLLEQIVDDQTARNMNGHTPSTSFFTLKNLEINFEQIAKNFAPQQNGIEAINSDNYQEQSHFQYQQQQVKLDSAAVAAATLSTSPMFFTSGVREKQSIEQVSNQESASFYPRQVRKGSSIQVKRGKKAMTLALMQNLSEQRAQHDGKLALNGFASGKQSSGNKSVQDVLLRLSIRSSLMVYKFIRMLKMRNRFRRITDLTANQMSIINDLCFVSRSDTQKLKRQQSKFSQFLQSWVCEQFLEISKLINGYVKILMKRIMESEPIDPTTNWMILWLSMQFIFIVVALFYTPLELINGDVYDQKYGESWVLYKFINMMAFLLDIFVKFNTGLFEKGQIVINRKEIVSSYARGNLIFDVLALIPMIQSVLNIEYLRPINLLILLKVQSARRILTQISETISQRSNRMQNALALLQLLLMICSVCHIFACMFMGIAVLEEKYELTHTTWMKVQKINGDDVHWFVKYTSALYFSVTTMITVGYGDIAPVTFYEILFVTIAMFVSCGVFAYSFNSIGDLVREQNRMSNEFKDEMVLVNRLLEKKKINRDLQIQVRKFLEFRFYAEPQLSMEEEQLVMSKLSHHLRDKVILESNLQIINQCSLFTQNFSKKFLETLALKITEVRVSKNEIIYEKDDVDTDPSLYIIDKGNIEVFVETDKGDSEVTILKEMQQGEYFGELQFFLESKRETSTRASSFTIIYGIAKSDFLTTIREFPEDFEIYSFMKDSFKYGNKLSMINLKCIICEKDDHHVASGCACVNYVPDKEKVILADIFSQLQPLRTSLVGSQSSMIGLEQRRSTKVNSKLIQGSIEEVQQIFMDQDENFNFISIHYAEFNNDVSMIDEILAPEVFLNSSHGGGAATNGQTGVIPLLSLPSVGPNNMLSTAERLKFNNNNNNMNQEQRKSLLGLLSSGSGGFDPTHSNNKLENNSRNDSEMGESVRNQDQYPSNLFNMFPQINQQHHPPALQRNLSSITKNRQVTTILSHAPPGLNRDPSINVNGPNGGNSSTMYPSQGIGLKKRYGLQGVGGQQKRGFASNLHTSQFNQEDDDVYNQSFATQNPNGILGGAGAGGQQNQQINALINQLIKTLGGGGIMNQNNQTQLGHHGTIAHGGLNSNTSILGGGGGLGSSRFLGGHRLGGVGGVGGGRILNGKSTLIGGGFRFAPVNEADENMPQRGNTRKNTRHMSQQNKRKEKEQLLAQMHITSQMLLEGNGDISSFFDKMKAYTMYYPRHNPQSIIKSLESYSYNQPSYFGVYSFKIRPKYVKKQPQTLTNTLLKEPAGQGNNNNNTNTLNGGINQSVIGAKPIISSIISGQQSINSRRSSVKGSLDSPMKKKGNPRDRFTFKTFNSLKPEMSSSQQLSSNTNGNNTPSNAANNNTIQPPHPEKIAPKSQFFAKDKENSSESNASSNILQEVQENNFPKFILQKHLTLS